MWLRCAQQVDGILTDVQTIATRVSHQTERVDHAITGTIDRVDETADRVKDTLRDKVAQATGVVRGIRAIIASLLTTEPAPKPRAAGRGPGVAQSGVRVQRQETKRRITQEDVNGIRIRSRRT